jgi:hypothetical protein
LACHAPPLGAGTPRRVSSWLLGHFAVAAGNGRERRPTLAESEVILARGAVGHDHPWFYRCAIEAALAAD